MLELGGVAFETLQYMSVAWRRPKRASIHFPSSSHWNLLWVQLLTHLAQGFRWSQKWQTTTIGAFLSCFLQESRFNSMTYGCNSSLFKVFPWFFVALIQTNSMQSHPWFLLMFSTLDVGTERSASPLLVLGEYVESHDTAAPRQVSRKAAMLS